jgi:hypothetical protein
VHESSDAVDGLQLLAGASSTRLINRGYMYAICASGVSFLLAIESWFKSIQGYYIATVCSVVFVALAIASGIWVWGYKKARLEVEHGYTTVVRTAAENPHLFLVDYKTLTVIARPHENGPTQGQRS